MYDTSGTHSVCDTRPADSDTGLRLQWLRGEIARAEHPQAVVWAREWERALAIARPVSTEQAYAKFGACLGLFPPFALFARIVAMQTEAGTALFWFVLLSLMNVVCWVVGWKLAAQMGRKLGDPRARGSCSYFFLSLLVGLGWAVVTGGAGGAVGFGIGAVVGVFCAVPVALAGFPLFAMLHRAHSHGGMIEERDLRPLAYGIPLTIAGIILSWH
jgi:hypothetical protein